MQDKEKTSMKAVPRLGELLVCAIISLCLNHKIYNIAWRAFKTNILKNFEKHYLNYKADT